jgi:hypothetical protein
MRWRPPALLLRSVNGACGLQAAAGRLAIGLGGERRHGMACTTAVAARALSGRPRPRNGVALSATRRACRSRPPLLVLPQKTHAGVCGRGPELPPAVQEAPPAAGCRRRKRRCPPTPKHAFCIARLCTQAAAGLLL